MEAVGGRWGEKGTGGEGEMKRREKTEKKGGKSGARGNRIEGAGDVRGKEMGKRQRSAVH